MVDASEPTRGRDWFVIQHFQALRSIFMRLSLGTGHEDNEKTKAKKPTPRKHVDSEYVNLSYTHTFATVREKKKQRKIATTSPNLDELIKFYRGGRILSTTPVLGITLRTTLPFLLLGICVVQSNTPCKELLVRYRGKST